MTDVALIKIGAAVTLTAATVLGLWTPFLCVRKTIDNTSPRPHVQLMEMSRLLSLANCLSAGLLIAMALVHFMPDAIVTAGDAVSPTVICATLMLGVLIPAVIELGTVDDVTHSGHGLGLMHEGHRRRLLMSFIMLPMCLHAAVEGVLLGLEGSTSALLGSAIPIFIHRFFDGVVVGVCIAKDLCVEMEELEEVAPPNATENSACGELYAMFRRRLGNCFIILWLGVMPAVLILCVALTDNSGVDGANTSLENTSLKCSTNAAGGSLGSRSYRGNLWLALARALGSGFFLFAGLVILMREELHEGRAGVALSVGVLLTSLLTAMNAH
ncbi:hypothetical protein TraAM80_01520 [Trypanosoma rangeli]|uniref:Zinc/iron permease n=1 Tax=Trypanosoma rangeli TaxID=5698 RepID=A0A3R7MSD3_TRYRA|nr:uncharacterized protein TraAM80_01520 [Trypanosoma rangeli]RNF10474.1 hypothetical protein TraAM80_01520 [Trypanosoma rangeli]|eukprot:RNF10474.1 hypothetical protein TraAM80_01520 [Trypanosoma rangeli]